VLTQAIAHARGAQETRLGRLIEWLRIPSISMEPQYAPEMERAARWLRDHLLRSGLAQAELIATSGQPIVYAEWLGAGSERPTILIYGHYDVQPADPIEAWRTPPFEPTVVGDNLYARGASDDKGQTFALVCAVESWLAAGGPPCNLKLLIEGEEEVSSANLIPFVREQAARLACDAVLIADSAMLSPQHPLVMLGVRGNCYLEVEARGPATDLHSGTYGGIVDNPLNVLVRLLAGLQAADGRILVPGFYDGVRELSAEERALLARMPVTEAMALALTGVPALGGEPGYSLVERATARPTLEIHGLVGGYTGPGKKTVIPTVARAKVGMRLVPDQNPEAIAALVRAFLLANCPPTVQLTVETLGDSWPALVDHRHPALQATIPAFRAALGAEPIFGRGGGSLPIVRDLQAALGAPVVLAGLGLPDDNLHAPNEKINLPLLFKGVEFGIHYFASIAESR
jgi:acetylornithine deacetylase/succinyl-diaminopimelate desuccinylase-like protein